MRRLITACVLSLPLLASAAQPDTARRVELLGLLQQDCGSCHGLRLKGGLGPALLPADLRGQTADSLFTIIKYGRPGTAMPPWGPLLGDNEIRWLVERLLAGDGAVK